MMYDIELIGTNQFDNFKYILTTYCIYRYVALNGVRLMLKDDNTLPDLVPKTQRASDGITIPSLTFGFFVFPDAKAQACL